MDHIYVVISLSRNGSDDGGLVKKVFKTFEDAKTTVLKRFIRALIMNTEDIGEYTLEEALNTQESTTGMTYIYIEKEHHIYIHKLKMPNN